MLKKFIPLAFGFFVLSNSNLAAAQSITSSPPAALLNSPSWDYSPSWMRDTVLGKERIWWCSDRRNGFNGEVEPSGEGDVIRLSEASPGQPYGPLKTVLTPTRDINGNYTTWEGACVCDPAVVRGNFAHNGATYNMAMYYTASATCTTNNKISVAFSNDGENWNKFGSPIINSQYATPTSNTYGAGQSQVRNVNGASGISMWHTDTLPSGQAIIFERYASDGINFSAPAQLSTSGIIDTSKFGGAAIALSPSAPYYLYMGLGDHPNGIYVYRIPYDQRFNGSWVYLGSVPKGNFNDVFEAGFRTDIYGNLVGDNPSQQFIGFGCGNRSDPVNWQICQATFTLN